MVRCHATVKTMHMGHCGTTVRENERPAGRGLRCGWVLSVMGWASVLLANGYVGEGRSCMQVVWPAVDPWIGRSTFLTGQGAGGASRRSRNNDFHWRGQKS